LAEQLAGTATERVRALARRGALATRDPDQRAAFLDAPELRAPSDLRPACDPPDPALQGALLRVAAAALDVGERDLARTWLDVASRSCEGAAADLLAAIGALDSELKLGSAASAGRAADASAGETRARFEKVVEDLGAPGAVTPDRLDALGRLTYVRVMQCLERDPGEALLVLERARGLRLALTTAAGLDATSAAANGVGLAGCHEPDRIPVLPRHALALVFLWDNRNGRLGRFAVMAGEDEPVVSFRWIACSERTLHELVDAFEQLREGSRPSEDLRSLLDEVLDETIAELLDNHPVVRRVIIVPHGPLAGLPLHMVIARRWPNVAVSYAPLLSLPKPERPAAQARALFCQLRGPTTVGDRDRIREEIKICRTILAGADLKAEAGPTTLESDQCANVPEVGLLHIASHGAAVGAEGGQRWRAGCIKLVDASGQPGQWTTSSILRAGRLHVDTVLLGCCEGGRSTNPSRMRTSRRTAAWQVAFLESAGHGIAGALLAAGAGEVLAYPHHVRVECPLQFFPRILCLYVTERAEGGVPGDYDWARATAAVLQDPELSGGDSSLQVELQLIQHWVAPETLARRDNRDGGAP
jgi:hypothetical protein